MTVGTMYTDNSYLEAIFNNQTAQTKHARIPFAAIVQAGGWFVDSVQANGPITYEYMKLVGVTPDERLIDIRNWNVGSKSERADTSRSRIPGGGAPPPNGASGLPVLQRLQGSRDQMTTWEPIGTEWAPGFAPDPSAGLREPAPPTASWADKVSRCQVEEGLRPSLGPDRLTDSRADHRW